MIVERVRSGLARAKAQGKRLGRPKLSPAKEHAVRAALEAGKGMSAIAREQHVGAGTVLRISRAMQAVD